jgi:NAD(P)H dehydrogenase (quinone)
MELTAQLPILVSGASGQLGRLILSELLDVRGVPAGQVIATTRTPEALSEFEKRGVIVRLADFDQPDSLPMALAGANRMLIISTTPEHDGHSRMHKQVAAIKAGIEAGVGHIIYTSVANAESSSPCFWHREHYETELALIDSGATWTVLRNWDYPNWHLEQDWSQALKTGEYWTARGAGRVNHITREDCARAAAGALLSDVSAHRRFDVTGPESFTAEEIMAILSDVTGMAIRVVHCTAAQLEARYIAMGINPHFIPFLIGYTLGSKHGHYDGITNAAEQLCGRKPTSLREWLVANVQSPVRGSP